MAADAWRLGLKAGGMCQGLGAGCWPKGNSQKTTVGPDLVWLVAVLYAMNELVPSTLMAVPIFWFQRMIINEERSSSGAQAQVHKLQRRQDELLDALLPPAIVGEAQPAPMYIGPASSVSAAIKHARCPLAAIVVVDFEFGEG